ncbi:MAG TPA: CehA/McbA family metallohydrolase, partial [Phycisphaerae bacterium]|nr:CehA/McbA family metallohydrolase [Phycisphaerae bacterium]
MQRLVLATVVTWIAAAASAHGPATQPAQTRETAAPARQAPRAGGLAYRAAEVGRRAGALARIAQAVVTDRNGQVNSLGATAQQIQFQRQLQAQGVEAGFGMRRWSDQRFALNVDAALDRADALLAEYAKALGHVKATVSPDGVAIAAGGALAPLAGRAEAVLVELVNTSGRPAPVRIAGSIGEANLDPLQANLRPGTTEWLLLPYAVPRAGAFRMHLRAEAGAGRAEADLTGAAAPSRKVTVRILDDATGNPSAARLWLHGADGRYALAGGRPVVLAGERTVYTFGYCDGAAAATVPAGKVHVRAQKGFEYEIAEAETDAAEITVRLKRWVDMPAAGWYGGDTHVHWVKPNWYENEDPAWLNVHSQAEDLWVNNNLILKHWWKNVRTREFPQGLVANRPDTFGVGKVAELSTGGRIVWTGEEYRNDEVFGHMVFLRIDRLIEPVSTGFMGGPEAVHWPPNSHTHAMVREAGGISIAAHDVVHEVPIQAILGALDSLDAHNPDRYYDLLNCGFRLPLSIGSDYPANLMGFARVYVQCGAKLDYDTWVNHLAAGRTFVSSGAMLLLEADGQGPGGAIDAGDGKEVLVKGRALCRTPLAVVEIVHNGKVVRRVTPRGDGRRIEFAEKLTVAGPGWLAVRAYGGGSPTWWGREG